MYEYIKKYRGRLRRLEFVCYPLVLLIIVLFPRNIHSTSDGIILLQTYPSISIPFLLAIFFSICIGSSYTQKTYLYYIFGMSALLFILLYIVVSNVFIVPINPAAPINIAFALPIIISLLTNATIPPREED